MELGITDLIRLGERDERLKMAAYCDFTINGVAKLLEEHLTITDKIDGMSCFGRDKLEKIGKLIKEKRTNLQAKAVKYHIDIQGNSTSLSSASSNLNMLQSSDDDQEEASKPGPLPASQTKKFTIYPPHIVHYGTPKRLPECRICKQLETQGDYRNLYDDHHGNYPTHCPRWAEMPMDERLTILQQAGYCDHCLHPQKRFRNAREVQEHKRDECSVTKKKNRYTCTVPNCSAHSWCCKTHRHKNEELLQAFKEEAKKRDQHFSFALIHAMSAMHRGNPQASPPRSPVRVSPGESNQSAIPSVTTAHLSPRHITNQDVEQPRRPSTGINTTSSGESIPAVSYAPATAPTSPRQASIPVHSERSSSLQDRATTPPGDQIPTIVDALKQIQAKELGSQGNSLENKVNLESLGRDVLNLPAQDKPIQQTIADLKALTPPGEELITKIKDPPLFMFSTTPGRDSDATIFYDTGNSHVLFQEGTPDNLYGTRTRCGPFSMGAVAATTVWGGDEWACQPMTTKGHREILIGLEVPKITTNFPYINIEEATAEIKASQPENRELQALSVPPVVGGECHILLGIQYSAHFPRLVHSLENGLGIYEVKLQPQSSRYTAAIAGPHHSFNCLADKVGNIAHLLQKFQEGISYWSASGPPPPASLPFTKEELALATDLNHADMATFSPADIDEWDTAPDPAPVGMCLTHAVPRRDGTLDQPSRTQKPSCNCPAPHQLACARGCRGRNSQESGLQDIQPPQAPKKRPRNPTQVSSGESNYPAVHSVTTAPISPRQKPRLPTETREDFLEDGDSDDSSEDFTPSGECGTFQWSLRRDWDKTERPGYGLSCAPLFCVSCCEDVQLEHQEANHIADEVNRVIESTIAGHPLRISTAAYEIYNVHDAQTWEPDLCTIKQFAANQETLIKIEYRCPTCRGCAPCRDALETEKISLREEAEEAEIMSSVKMDFANKRFICSLPMRGAPEDFLSSNKHSADKILQRQLALYHKDEETKKLILKAMNKLFDRGHVALLKDLPKDQQEAILNAPVTYFIPWRIVFKPGSLSTPARPVFDCSSKTPLRVDGTGGHCLNDLMCKGRNMSFNLVKMLLRFSIGTHALSGDIKQFYNVFKLLPEFWHLQLFLWKEEMNPDNETMIGVIKTLIYGNKASAPQSEEGMKQFAEIVRRTNPRLADFLLDSRYVDDCNDSFDSMEAINRIQEATDKEFASLGAEIKGWGKTGHHPSPEISENGIVGVAGLAWTPIIDAVELKIQPLHFGKVTRGRLAIGTKTFDGNFASFDDMNSFVPRKLTRRQVVSKLMSIFDLQGRMIPLTARFKRDMRTVMAATLAWDEAVTNEHRSKWVKNFMDMEAMKGIKFTRPRMPQDAVDTKMRLQVLVDASKEIISIWAGVGFKRKNGKWSCAYLIGRCLLAALDSTIPRDEMEALVAGSNMLWLLRQILAHWVDTFLLAGDAQIPLFWVLSEKKRLGLWHRTRSVQIRRGTPLENIYHVKTTENIADIPTRPDKLTIQDVGPGSKWENGLEWMTEDLDTILEQGILTPISDLNLNPDYRAEYEDGFVLERAPDILTQGHLLTMLTTKARIEKTTARATFSSYIILPTKFEFTKVVRILSICFKFVSAFKDKWSKKHEREQAPPVQLRSFTLPTGYYRSSDSINPTGADISELDELPLTCQFGAYSSYYTHNPDESWGKQFSLIAVRIQETDIQWALHYYYATATREVEHFVKPDIIARIAIKKGDILFNKSRILDGRRFLQTAGLENSEILRDQGINAMAPVIDRWSPLAYAIGDHIHRRVAKHAGFETCFRHSHAFVHILQGFQLFQELGEDCVTCQKLNSRFIQASMGPIDDAKLTVAPAFWISQMDIWGPITVFVPGREKNTRNSPALTAKIWIQVTVCVITKNVNLQVVEGHDARSLGEGITRLICEVGTPARLCIDQDSALMKTLRDGECQLIDLETQVRRKSQMDFTVCPVSGHNSHGLVEAKIRVAQTGFEKSGANQWRMHATGAQTLMKAIENDMNNTPFGVTAGRCEGNTPILKLISPAMLRIGRINSRTPAGPFLLPTGPRTIMDRVEQSYKLWYSAYQDSLLQKYLLDLQPRWFKSDTDTRVGDIVYFRKREGKLNGPWTMGRISETTRSRDGVIRRADIEYHDLEGTLQTTDRSVRSVVKLFNLEDGFWRADMDAVAHYAEQLDLDIPNGDDFRHKDGPCRDYNFTGESTSFDMDISAPTHPQASADPRKPGIHTEDRPYKDEEGTADNTTVRPATSHKSNRNYADTKATTTLQGETTVESIVNPSAATTLQAPPGCETCCCEAHHRFCLTTSRR